MSLRDQDKDREKRHSSRETLNEGGVCSQGAILCIIRRQIGVRQGRMEGCLHRSCTQGLGDIL